MKNNSKDLPLRILIISDGRLGRYRRSQTIAAAISRKRPAIVNTVEISPNPRLHKYLGKITGFSLPPKLLLTILLGNRWQDFPVSDLIISSGGMSLQANIALAKIWGVPNIFSGDRRRISSDPDLVLTMNPDNTDAPNHQFALTCARLDPDDLPPPNREIGTIGVLVGGPNDEIEYSRQDWILFAGIIEKLAADNFALTVATSPRTPEAFYDALGDLADTVKLIDFRSTGPAELDEVFSLDAMLVSIDSTSMIVEGISARRPVIALKPNDLERLPDASLFKNLTQEKRLQICSLNKLSAAEIVRKLQTLEPMNKNVLEIIYQMISPKLV
ncbi:MAG: ELM1/GtrOC1 family putative glycosyltransferase [Pseudomonadota bacterium]